MANFGPSPLDDGREEPAQDGGRGGDAHPGDPAGLLVFIPADFEMEARGKLEPVVRRVVFARTDGVIDEVRAVHSQMVHQGDLLVLLRNTAFEYQLASISGELQTTSKKLAAAQASLLVIDRGTAADRSARVRNWPARSSN